MKTIQHVRLRVISGVGCVTDMINITHISEPRFSVIADSTFVINVLLGSNMCAY